ncbi:MAG: hypothetical protein Q7T72_04960, partial [Bacteroidales bacterium]|nr:hypothetical protein [Bacteroidales bacterium]
MKMLKKSFPEFLSICKIFGTAVFLLLGNPSEGVGLPGNSIIFSNVDVSSPVVADLNPGSNPIPFGKGETASLSSFPVSAPATDPVDVTVCEGGNATFTVTGGSSYIWDVSTDNGASWSPISGEITSSLIRNSVTYIMNGYKYRCTVDGVSGNPATLTVLRYPAAAGAITGINTVCQGDVNISYSVPPIANSDQYIWTLPTGVSIISGNGSKDITVNFSSAAVSGYMTVKGTNGGLCDGVTSQIYLTVNQFPVAAGTITGTSTVCQGQNTVSYSVPVITNATSYTWAYSGSGATINGTTNNITINFATNATSGDLTVTGTNSCGNGTISAIHSIAVNPLPAPAGIISGLSPVCQGQNTVSYSVDAITNATSYIWAYSGSGATINGTTNNITINFSAGATAGNLTVKGHNNCGDGIISAIHPIAVNPLPDAALGISGPITVCQGATESYSVPLITNATSYTWAYSGAGATINGTEKDITITFATNATAGNLTVKGHNDCGDGTISTIHSIAVNPLPVAAGSVSGLTPVCQGQTGVSYSVPAIANADVNGYVWSLPPGATITAGANTRSITVDFSSTALSGSISVYGNNACGNGTVSVNYAIIVNPLPAAAGSVSGLTPVCQGQTGVSYSVPAITNASGYVWTLPYGATIATGDNTRTITVNFSSTALDGIVSVYGINGCSNGTASPAHPVTVTP